MKKFELTTESKTNWFGKNLFRIKACIDFVTTSGDKIHAGDLGGYVEKEQNLSHDGKAWVCGNAEVCGDAEVCGNAKVCGDAKVWDNAKVWSDAKVYGDAEVCGDANIFSTEHIFCITPIGEYAQSLTLFRTKKCEIKVSFELEIYALDEFRKMVADWDDTKQREVALAVLEIGQKHIDLTPTADEYEPCPFCGGEAEYNADSDVVVCTKCCASVDKKIWNRRIDD